MSEASQQEPTTQHRGGGCLTRALAMLLAAAFVASFPLTLTAFDTAQVLFSPDEIAAAFSEELVASGLLEEAMVNMLLGGELTQAREEEARALEGALEFLGPVEMQQITRALLPADWASSQVSALVRDLYAWLDTEAANPELLLDLRPLKEHLFQQGLPEMVEVVVDSWPSCSLEEIERLREVQFRLGELPDFVCEPPEPMRTDLIATATDYLQGQFREIPPTLALIESDPDTDQAGQLKNLLRLIRAVAEAAWLLPLSLLGLIMALAIRSFDDLTRWWGIPFALSALGTLVAVFLVPPLANRTLQRTLGGSEVPAMLGESFLAITQRLADSISGLLFAHAVFLLFIGGGLLLLGRFLRRRQPSS